MLYNIDYNYTLTLKKCSHCYICCCIANYGLKRYSMIYSLYICCYFG